MKVSIPNYFCIKKWSVHPQLILALPFLQKVCCPVLVLSLTIKQEVPQVQSLHAKFVNNLLRGFLENIFSLNYETITAKLNFALWFRVFHRYCKNWIELMMTSSPLKQRKVSTGNSVSIAKAWNISSILHLGWWTHLF